MILLRGFDTMLSTPLFSQLRFLILRTVRYVFFLLLLGASALYATTATAQSRSRLGESNTQNSYRATRASVPDASLYDDMVTIVPRGDTRRAVQTPTATTAPASIPATTTGTRGDARTLPADHNTRATATAVSAPTASSATATTDYGRTLFASATLPDDDTQRAHPTPRKSRGNETSEAYVPMLPEDFYAPTYVTRDPVASEIGVPDMEPASNATGGFRYMQRRPIESTSARPGVAMPYPMTNVFSTYSDCRPGGRTHAGLDVGGVGPDGGIGTPVYAMTRAKVTFIGRPEDDPDKFGRPLNKKGTVQRGSANARLPASAKIPGYGTVRFFTQTYGSWRTGTILVMEALDGPLKDHRIRYMHLGAIHPNLKPGDIVESGQEVGLMGGTAVLHDMPHMHIDIETAKGKRVDVAPFVGLPSDNGRCRR